MTGLPGPVLPRTSPSAQAGSRRRAWLSLSPDRGGRADTTFHLTVVRTRDFVRRAAIETLAAYLPLTVKGTELWAAERTADGGRHMQS